jgi:hypothetical protein
MRTEIAWFESLADFTLERFFKIKKEKFNGMFSTSIPFYSKNRKIYLTKRKGTNRSMVAHLCGQSWHGKRHHKCFSFKVFGLTFDCLSCSSARNPSFIMFIIV